MELFSGFATLLFVIVGATVGIRLLILGHRTKELPERAVGLALFLIGGIGYPLAVAAGTPDLMAPEVGARLTTTSAVIIDAGFIAVATFTWAVFRRQQTWGRLLYGFLCVGYVTHAVALTLATAELTNPAYLMQHAFVETLGGQLLNSIAFGWTAVEAYRYWWMLRKRLSIGIGDPVTTNRFLLWAMAATASVLTNGISWWVISNGVDFFQSPTVQVAIGLLSVGSCTTQYLAFLPPKAYVERIRRSAAATASA